MTFPFYLPLSLGLTLTVPPPETVDQAATSGPTLSHETALATYSDNLSFMRQKQQQWAAQYRAGNPATRRRIEGQALRFVSEMIRKRLMPAWLGTPWFMGKDEDAAYPHQPGKRVSCSYLVMSILENSGFVFCDKRAFAHSPALHIQRSFAPRPQQVMRHFSISPAQLETHLARLPTGLYLIGLNCHIGFIVVTPQKATFFHSNYVDPEHGVIAESVSASIAIANSQAAGCWITPLLHDKYLIRYWLTGEAVPLKPLDLVP